MAGKKKGLYANIAAKRKAGKKPRRKGAKGAPSDADFKRAGQNRQKEVMDIRSEVINKLRLAVSQATAGEIHRAVEFLAFAREVRVGKHDLRRKGRVLTQQVRGGGQ
jgi:hypothetical protein